MQPILTIKQLTKSFEGKSALRGVSFDVCPGEIVALLGPSGCGKSTLLTLVAGLDTADSGEVLWQGERLAGKPPHTRGFGLMFQDYALFPHLTVAENVAFGLRYQAIDRTEAQRRVGELLALVNLAGFEGRDVSSLSGGEQQRVALARSLAPRPHLLMLDEPLGALDAAMRERLLADVQAILRELDQTALYVTHDQSEAFAVADRVVVMQAGRVEQIGTPQEIYLHPNSRFVAEFLGFDNFIPGKLEKTSSGIRLRTAFGVIEWPASERVGDVDVLLRPDEAGLSPAQGTLSLAGTVRKKSFRGTSQRLRVNAGGVIYRFNFQNDLALPDVGEQITLSIPSKAVQVFDKGDA